MGLNVRKEGKGTTLVETHTQVFFTPAEGEEVLILDEKEDRGVIPRNKDGWRQVPYVEATKVLIERFDQSNLNVGEGNEIEISCEAEDTELFSIYQHHIGEFTNIDRGTVVWQAYDIPFNSRWKEYSAKYLGGICEGELGIVRLLHEGPKSSYHSISLYMLNNLFSKIFADLRREEIEATNEMKLRLQYGRVAYDEYIASLHTEPLTVSYNEKQCEDLGDNYKTLVQAFRYAYELNDRKAFSIVEQLYDFRNNGEAKEMLSKLEPRTEAHIEYNIFKSDIFPPSIVTNFNTNVYICDYDHGHFNITRKR